MVAGVLERIVGDVGPLVAVPVILWLCPRGGLRCHREVGAFSGLCWGSGVCWLLVAWGGTRCVFGGWVLGLGGACFVCWFWLWGGVSGWDVDGVLLNLLTVLLVIWFLLLKKILF